MSASSLPTPVTEAEMVCGCRADYHVYYRRDGRLRFDAIWADDPDAATHKMLLFAKELRWQIQIVRVVRVTPDA